MIRFWTSVNYSFWLPPSLFPHHQQHLIKGLFTSGGASYRWEIVFRNWAILLLLLTIATAQLSFSRMEFPSIYSFFFPFFLWRGRRSFVKDWKFFFWPVSISHKCSGGIRIFSVAIFIIFLFFLREIRRLLTSKLVTHATGLFSFLLQLHTHLRVPSFEEKE